MPETVLALAGPTRSGKTTLARALAENLGWSVASFGDEVRRQVKQRGLRETRGTLQAVGEDLVATNGVEFCRAVLSQADWGPDKCVIVDGVRHSSILHDLRKLVAPTIVRLVFITVDAETRRLRTHGSGGDMAHQDLHSTEAQVHGDLRRLADLEVDGAQPAAANVMQVIKLLGL